MPVGDPLHLSTHLVRRLSREHFGAVRPIASTGGSRACPAELGSRAQMPTFVTRSPIVVALCVLAAAALGACGSSGGAASTSGAGAPAGLTGTQWVLDSAALGVPGAARVTSWMRLERGQVSGDDGCNRFSGGYSQSGSALRFGPLAGTRRHCPGAAVEVGTRVTAALEATRSFALRGGELVLRDAGGAELLRYRASAPHVEGHWEATSVLYADGIHSVIIGTTLTADFATGGKLSGSGGCNDFSGGYTAQDTTLRIGPLVSTQKACAGPEGANEQEQGYLAALESARTFDQAGDALTIFDAQGRMAVTLARAG